MVDFLGRAVGGDVDVEVGKGRILLGGPLEAEFDGHFKSLSLDGLKIGEVFLEVLGKGLLDGVQKYDGAGLRQVFMSIQRT